MGSGVELKLVLKIGRIRIRYKIGASYRGNGQDTRFIPCRVFSTVGSINCFRLLPFDAKRYGYPNPNPNI